MPVNAWIYWLSKGFRTFVRTLVFFYSHPLLIVISLIPSVFRAIQILQEMQTPIWMEIGVESSRFLLFVLMLVLLEKTGFHSLNRSEFWERLQKTSAAHTQKNWPKLLIAEIVVFIILMYGLMNGLIELAVNTVLLPMSVSILQVSETQALHDAWVFFLKNLSVIPMSMAYMLRVLGVGTGEKSAL